LHEPGVQCDLVGRAVARDGQEHQHDRQRWVEDDRYQCGAGQRGTADGTLRTDLPLPTLLAAYTGLLRGIGSLVIRGEQGVEETSAAITTMLLAGARRGP
jgi:hypothetical protein